jgi:hypothetical protein
MTAEHSTPPIDCREFRRRLLIDPYDPDPRLRRHREQCAACDRAANEALAFEAALRRALSVSPPRGLANRIKAAAGRHRPARPGAGAAAVALLALAVWVGVGVFPTEPELSTVVARHIEAEEEHLHARHAVGPSQLADLLAPLGGELTGRLGQVHFAELCVIRDARGAHLVVKGRRGPVTVLFMPGESPGRARSVSTGRLRGMIVPTAYGSLAVVGEPGEPIREWAEEAQRAVRWRG